jgi:spore maturation protein CgeB
MPYIAGITDCFRDREEAVFYAFGNWTQLKNLIDYYLVNDVEREDIRRAGHERTKRDHTYTRRMTEMLEVLRQEGAIK